jgi:localization factor PodJL
MMQPDLPWNVAGIPPEAREAARAAARREGLSVGEWLTRRILRSLTDGPPSESWSQNGSDAFRADDSASRDSDAMFARISRSESESNGAYLKIEDQIRNLGRRLEAAERNQSENSRAVSKAATEISIAAREQAQAFDQLGQHVVGLGDRLTRVERGSANDGVKDAVKGLHAGLSRLADQISETANQSAGQIATLAGNIEAVAGKLNAVRGKAESGSQALAQRIAAIDERVKTLERVTHGQSEKLERAIADLETAQRGHGAESQRHAQTISQVTETLDKLAARLTGGEAQTAGALARLEDQLAKFELRQIDPAFDRRLQGIEHALSDIAGRLENNERNTTLTARSVEESLGELSARVDAADKRNREAIVELRSALPSAAPPPPPPLAQPPLAQAATNFDLPPFPDAAAPAFAAVEPPPFAATPAGFAGAPGFASDPAAAADSFISAARRSVRSASPADVQPGLRAGFSWGASAVEEPQSPKARGRIGFAGGIAVIAGAAIVSGILLSRGFVGSRNATPHPAPITHRMPTPARPAPAARVDDIPLDTTRPAAASPAPEWGAAPANRATVEITPAAPIQSSPAATVPHAATVSTLDRLIDLANAGREKAQLLIGLKYLDGDGVTVNEAEAAKWLERAANQGDAIASNRLGTLFERGHGVPADPAKAVRLYTAAAKLGNLRAMHNLAVAFAEGSGVAKDLTQAVQWFSKAASLGYADSQFNLAVLYERGMGVQQSLIDAYKWYSIAAAQGDSESKTRLDVIATQLSADERAAAQRAAAEFHPMPSDRAANVPPDASTLN